MKATITYIHHNCFCLELGGKTLLFDPPAPEHQGPGSAELIRRKLDGADCLVFCSHSHEDHCSKEVLRLVEGSRSAQFILSYDVPELIEELDLPDAIVIDPDEDEVEQGELKVSGLESTDLGVAFLFTLAGAKIYFGGDLAEWSWETLDERALAAEKRYFEECLGQIKDFDPDIVFTNADPRLANRGGAKKLADLVRPKVLVPMHLFGETSLMDELEDTLAIPGTELFAYRSAGEVLATELGRI